ncbi:hypothetical protein L3V86_08495 [Thiotrichales bacterium 19S11-10]|nr:hypothetical protein [Thiotrichales bacterium 19S11-10]
MNYWNLKCRAKNCFAVGIPALKAQYQHAINDVKNENVRRSPEVGGHPVCATYSAFNGIITIKLKNDPIATTQKKTSLNNHFFCSLVTTSLSLLFLTALSVFRKSAILCANSGSVSASLSRRSAWLSLMGYILILSQNILPKNIAQSVKNIHKSHNMFKL